MAVILSGLAALGLSGSYNHFGSAASAPTAIADWGACPHLRHWGRCARRSVQRIRPLLQFARQALGSSPAYEANADRSGSMWIFGCPHWRRRRWHHLWDRYAQARSAVEGHSLPQLFFLEKFVSSFLSMMSGIPGGIFAPSLSIGAGIGSAVGHIIGADLGLAAILGMAGYFAGVVQAPMTAFVIILEMTGDHRAVIPILAVAMIGYVTSRFLSREPLYHGLSRVFIAAAIRSRRSLEKVEQRPQTSSF